MSAPDFVYTKPWRYYSRLGAECRSLFLFQQANNEKYPAGTTVTTNDWPYVGKGSWATLFMQAGLAGIYAIYYSGNVGKGGHAGT